MNDNSEAIKIFCSHLCVGDDVQPLEPAEWSELAQLLHVKNLQPCDLLKFTADDLQKNLHVSDRYAGRLVRLVDRSASLAFELEKFINIGINVVTRADKDYPLRLKKALGNSCPPLFYYAGDLRLLNEPLVGYVGSRDISDADRDFTRRQIKKTVRNGFGIVSGGAKGIDSVSEEEGLRLGCPVVEFLSDSMIRRLKYGAVIQAIQDGTLLLLSAVKPDAGFNTGTAMMRNRFIYAQSQGTVIIKSDFNKGGTWTGAVENLRHGWCTEFCWNNIKYKGNRELIRRNAVPVDDGWDGNVQGYSNEKINLSDPAQISIFED